MRGGETAFFLCAREFFLKLIMMVSLGRRKIAMIVRSFFVKFQTVKALTGGILVKLVGRGKWTFMKRNPLTSPESLSSSRAFLSLVHYRVSPQHGGAVFLPLSRLFFAIHAMADTLL